MFNSNQSISNCFSRLKISTKVSRMARKKWTEVSKLCLWMTPFPRNWNLSTKRRTAVQCPLPREDYWAVVTTETSIQTTAGTRKHRVENWTLVTIINLRFWSLWLGKGTGEERRQTLAAWPETALAPLTEATGVKVPWAEALLFIWGAGRIQNPSRSYRWSSKSKDRAMFTPFQELQNPGLKTPASEVKGTWLSHSVQSTVITGQILRQGCHLSCQQPCPQHPGHRGAREIFIWMNVCVDRCCAGEQRWTGMVL